MYCVASVAFFSGCMVACRCKVILGDPGTVSPDDAIFLGESLHQERGKTIAFALPEDIELSRLTGSRSKVQAFDSFVLRNNLRRGHDFRKRVSFENLTVSPKHEVSRGGISHSINAFLCSHSLIFNQKRVRK